MFEEGFGEHQNRKADTEELARQEAMNCVDSCPIYIPPVRVYFNFKIMCVLFFIVYSEIVCHVLCDM